MKNIEIIVPPEGLTITFPPTVKPVVKRTVKPVDKPKVEDKLFIHIDEKGGYLVRVGDVERQGKTLRQTVLDALEGKDIPDFLSEQERKTLEGILNVEG